MKSLMGKMHKAAVKICGIVVVLALTLLPAWALVHSFNANAIPLNRKVVKIESLKPRPQDQQPLQPFNEPLITVSFDDGWESVYTQALSILQQDNIPTTQFIIAGEFSNSDYMSLDQVKSLKNAGHEIGSHTMTHPDLTRLSDGQIMQELGDSKATLATIQPGISDFAIPYGAINSKVTYYIKKYYRSDRLSDGSKTYSPINDINTSANFDIYGIRAIAVTAGTNLATLQSYINYAKNNNGWLVLVYHQINKQPNDEYAIDKEVFKKQMDLINKSGVRIATEGRVLDALQGL